MMNEFRETKYIDLNQTPGLLDYNDTEHRKEKPEDTKDYRRMATRVWRKSRKPAGRIMPDKYALQ